jgi:hypothetical protein
VWAFGSLVPWPPGPLAGVAALAAASQQAAIAQLQHEAYLAGAQQRAHEEQAAQPDERQQADNEAWWREFNTSDEYAATRAFIEALDRSLLPEVEAAAAAAGARAFAGQTAESSGAGEDSCADGSSTTSSQGVAAHAPSRADSGADGSSAAGSSGRGRAAASLWASSSSSTPSLATWHGSGSVPAVPSLMGSRHLGSSCASEVQPAGGEGPVHSGVRARELEKRSSDADGQMESPRGEKLGCERQREPCAVPGGRAPSPFAARAAQQQHGGGDEGR